VAVPSPVARPPWSFVGREHALDVVRRALVDRSSAGLLVRGPAGIGKSALVAEAIAGLAPGGEGPQILELAARRTRRDLPFDGLATALPGLVAGTEGGHAALLARSVRTVVEGGWDAVWVDDVAHLDVASAQVLHHLATTAGLPLVLAARTGEELPEPIVALRVSGAVEVLALGPLDDGDVLHLVEGALGSQVDEATARRFALLSEGSPLHLRELVRAAMERDVLRTGGGIVRWDPTTDGAWALGGLVRERLGRLGPEAFRAVAMVALADDLPRRLLDEVVGAEAVREAELADALVASARAVGLRHPLIGEVALDGLDASARRDLERCLAEAFGEGGAAPDLLRSIAFQTDAGDEVAPSLLIEAAAEAQRRGSAATAERLARRASASGGPQAHVALGSALLALGRDRDAELAFEHALAEAPEGELALRAATGAHRAARRLGRVDAGAARALLAQVERLGCEAPLPTTTIERALAQVEAANGLLAASEVPAARALAAAIADDRSLPASVRAQALPVLAISLALTGDDAGAPLDPGGLASAATGHDASLDLLVLAQRGDAHALRRRAAEARGAHGPAGSDAATPAASEAEGLADLASGQASAAVRALRNAAAAHDRAAGAGWRQLVVRCRLVEALARSGDLAGARRELAALASGAPAGLAAGELAGAELWVEVLDPSPPVRADAIAGMAIAAIADADRLGLHHRSLVLAAFAWRAGHWPAGHRDLAERAARSSGPWAEAMRAWAAATEADDAPALLAASDELARLGRWLEAAEAAADAAGAFDRAGARRRAIAATLEADRLLERTGSATTIRQRPEIDVPALSAREAEIARLVAAGLTNRAIANQLVLSVRTVEGHVLRASAKLGVDSRDALAALVTAPMVER
jgi:DNA-binding CsgD family transcriptional regulator